MYYDYHMHCDFSRDSKTPMEDMIRKSIDLKLSEICFTDHSDYSILVNNIEQDHEVDYKNYLKSLEFFQNKYKKEITIKKGVEIGLQNHTIDKCIEDIKSYDFDFVIASIHTINKSDLIDRDFYKNKSQYEAYRQYYENLYNIIKKTCEKLKDFDDVKDDLISTFDKKKQTTLIKDLYTKYDVQLKS